MPEKSVWETSILFVNYVVIGTMLFKTIFVVAQILMAGNIDYMVFWTKYVLNWIAMFLRNLSNLFGDTNLNKMMPHGWADISQNFLLDVISLKYLWDTGRETKT